MGNNKTYLYSRVSTSEQTVAQQERTVYEYTDKNHMHVDEVIVDEGISGGVSYKDRNLGKVLLPKLNAGDVVIVSEISRLGRSMFDLFKLIHEEFKPRKVRLIIVGMGIDLRCNEMRPIDNLILNNFSFSAELEKHLIQSRTKSAMEVKRKQGIKFGSANETYRKNYENKTREEKLKIAMKRGMTKNARYLASKDIVAFTKVLRNVFKDACADEDPNKWDWQNINTKGDNKYRALSLMRDYHELDGTLFRKWDFSDLNDVKLQVKLASRINQLRTSHKLAAEFESKCHYHAHEDVCESA